MKWLGFLFIGAGFILMACGMIASCFAGDLVLERKRKRLQEQKSLPAPNNVAVWRERRALARAKRLESETARKLRPQLYSDDNEQVILAAQTLGTLHDRTAVPAMMEALESSVAYQPLGWREVAVALTNALSEIGDSRALPLLHRLENVRGIGLISHIRHAIATIEPQANLLRAGYPNAIPEHLLRPAQGTADAPELLLRPISNTDILD